MMLALGANIAAELFRAQPKRDRILQYTILEWTGMAMLAAFTYA
jgi:hypothetical protein